MKDLKRKLMSPNCMVCDTPLKDTGRIRPSDFYDGKNVRVYFCSECNDEHDIINGAELMNNELVQPREPEE